MFLRAMELRVKEPRRSRDMFYKILQYAPDNHEARLKASLQEIRLGKYNSLGLLLEPVISSTCSTLEQKQRAYCNLTCSCLFKNPPDFVAAEDFSWKGISLDGKGTKKLWENYAMSLLNQDRLVETRDAFTKALCIDPTSVHAQACLKDVEKKLKQQQKSKLKEKENKEGDTDKENSNRTPGKSNRTPGKSNRTPKSNQTPGNSYRTPKSKSISPKLKKLLVPAKKVHNC